MQDIVNKRFDKQIGRFIIKKQWRICLGLAVEESAGFSRD